MNTHEAQSALRQLINQHRALKHGEELFAKLGKAEGEMVELERTIAEQHEASAAVATEHKAASARFSDDLEQMQGEHDDLTAQIVSKRTEYVLAEDRHTEKLQEATNAERDRREALVQDLHQAEIVLRDEITKLAQARDELSKELASIRARFI